MAKKKRSSKIVQSPLTEERKARLFRLVNMLEGKPLPREVLTKKLGLGVRDFYRDLKTLREIGVEISLKENKYHLLIGIEQAKMILPFPDPHLTFGEAEQLAKGRNKVHQKLSEKLVKYNTPEKPSRSRGR